jgi:hypothetical protein
LDSGAGAPARDDVDEGDDDVDDDDVDDDDDVAAGLDAVARVDGGGRFAVLFRPPPDPQAASASATRPVTARAEIRYGRDRSRRTATELVVTRAF